MTFGPAAVPAALGCSRASSARSSSPRSAGWSSGSWGRASATSAAGPTSTPGRTRSPMAWSRACGVRTPPEVRSRGRGDRVPPPRRRRGVRVEQVRVVERRVTRQPGEDPVVHGAGLADQLEHPPQRARVAVRALEAVPLVQTAVATLAIVGEPELRHEAGEAHEHGRVEQALPSEPAVPPAAHRAEPERHRQEARLGHRSARRRLAVDPGGGPVGEPQLPTEVAAGSATFRRTSIPRLTRKHRDTAAAARPRGSGRRGGPRRRRRERRPDRAGAGHRHLALLLLRGDAAGRSRRCDVAAAGHRCRGERWLRRRGWTLRHPPGGRCPGPGPGRLGDGRDRRARLRGAQQLGPARLGVPGPVRDPRAGRGAARAAGAGARRVAVHPRPGHARGAVRRGSRAGAHGGRRRAAAARLAATAPATSPDHSPEHSPGRSGVTRAAAPSPGARPRSPPRP